MKSIIPLALALAIVPEVAWASRRASIELEVLERVAASMGANPEQFVVQVHITCGIEQSPVFAPGSNVGSYTGFNFSPVYGAGSRVEGSGITIDNRNCNVSSISRPINQAKLGEIKKIADELDFLVARARESKAAASKDRAKRAWEMIKDNQIIPEALKEVIKLSIGAIFRLILK